MARSVTVRKYPMGRAGGHAALIDTTGMPPEMIIDLTGTKMNKLESDFVKGTGRASSVEAVRRARRANKQPPLKEG